MAVSVSSDQMCAWRFQLQQQSYQVKEDPIHKYRTSKATKHGYFSLAGVSVLDTY